MKKEFNCGVPSWEEIQNRVIEHFNGNDICDKYSVSLWQEELENVRGARDAGEILHHFTVPNVIDAAIEFFKSSIEENRAIFQVKVKMNRRRMKLMALQSALGEDQGLFVNEEEGEMIVPELLAVIRVNKTERLQQIIQTSMSLARDEKGECKDQPSWPSGTDENFSNDLTKFINTNGDEGRELVTRVCEDIGFARTVHNDEEMPMPIRFLAQIVTEAGKDTHIHKKKKIIGFASSSRS